MRAPLGLAAIGAFFAASVAFLAAPAAMLVVQALHDDDGHFTFAYFAALDAFRYRLAFANSLELSALSATTSVAAGGLIAFALASPGVPRPLRAAATSFAAVATNFAGVPLAFSFIATLGALGMATKAMARAGFDLYAHGFSLYSISGLVLVYGYFQVPLMAIVIAPAIDGLRSTWREAAANLGASGLQFWRLVGLPMLAPSLLSAWILLFGSAFSAYATAYALTAGNIALVTTEIASVLSGNVVSAPQIGAALSIGMIAAMTATLVLSGRLAARAARWSAR